MDDDDDYIDGGRLFNSLDEINQEQEDFLCVKVADL